VAARVRAAGIDGTGALAEDLDIVIALRFGVDPHTVDHGWPLELRERVHAYLEAESAVAERVRRRAERRARRR